MGHDLVRRWILLVVMIVWVVGLCCLVYTFG